MMLKNFTMIALPFSSLLVLYANPCGRLALKFDAGLAGERASPELQWKYLPIRYRVQVSSG